jgi:lipopolysaccharide export LptBFGC system permease protein LptF
MLIFWYLTRRFVTFVTAITVLLTFLFNFVEFFEKLVRIKSAGVGVIIHFLALNCIPTFFDLLPIGMWLATCFLLKELYQYNEWDLLQLLTYIPTRFLSFALIMGLVFSFSTFVIHENYVANLLFKAERFKQENLKQGAVQKLVSTWLELDHDKVCYFGVLDPKTGQGQDMILIEMTPQFALQNIIKAGEFHIDTTTNAITLSHAEVFDMNEHEEKDVDAVTITSPAFFSQLKISLEAPTLGGTIRKVLFYQDILPKGIYDELVGQMCSRLMYFLQLLLYPLLVICLFLWVRHPYFKWVAAMGAYPLMLMASVGGDSLFHRGLGALGMLSGYIAIILFIACFWVRSVFKK